MFNRSPSEAALDAQILRALNELDNHKVDSEEYGAIVERLSKLEKLKSEEGLKLPSLDTALVVAANIFGIVWLTRYERENVITSKALGFVMKAR